MTSEEYQKRLERAQNETFVIARTDEGFRIHAPANGGHVYYVTGSPESPACSCPDFQHHAKDPDWRCKHILAVLARNGGTQKADVSGSEAPAAQEPARLTLKRSVSPDGRIDALSVEVSLPLHGSTTEEAESRSREVLALQDQIAKGFLNDAEKANGTPQHQSQPSPASHNGSEPATILEVGGMEGRWGRRLFLTFQVNGRRLRLFGSEKKLAQAIRYAGYPHLAEELEEGMRLQIPCRVVTQPTEDGKYVNVVRVYPADTERSLATW